MYNQLLKDTQRGSIITQLTKSFSLFQNDYATYQNFKNGKNKWTQILVWAKKNRVSVEKSRIENEEAFAQEKENIMAKGFENKVSFTAFAFCRLSLIMPDLTSGAMIYSFSTWLTFY